MEMLRLGAVDYVLKDRMARLPSAVHGALEYAAEHHALAAAEDKLRASEERYRRIVETANDGIMLVDAEFRVTFYNRRLAAMFGYDDQELIGTSPGAWNEDDDTPLVHQHFHAIRAGRSREFEGQLLRKDGTPLWVRVSASQIHDGDDNYDGFLAMVSDISGLKEAEQRLKNAVSGTVAAMGALVETRDPYTAGHERRVAELSAAIARRLGLRQDEIEDLALTARTHDIGKIAVPAEILTKPSRLTCGGVQADQAASAGGGRHPLDDRLRLPRGRGRPAAPRAPGRLRVSAGPLGRRHPAPGPHPRRVRRGGGHVVAPAVPPRPGAGAGAERDPRGRRPPVRRRRGGGLLAGVRGGGLRVPASEARRAGGSSRYHDEHVTGLQPAPPAHPPAAPPACPPARPRGALRARRRGRAGRRRHRPGRRRVAV